MDQVVIHTCSSIMLISLENIIQTYNLKIQGVIHIGAHYGEEYDDYVKVGIKNMMFFEPIKASCEKLMKKVVCSDTVQVFRIALGNKTGLDEMNVEKANQGQSNSLLLPGTHLTQYPQIKFVGKEQVVVMRLDDIVFDRSQFNMINIDVQGYELEVFKGAIETLPFIDVIYSEINTEQVYRGCCQVEELDEFLGKFGFSRVMTDLSPKSWGDAVYLKQK